MTTKHWKEEIENRANGSYGNAINYWSYLDWIKFIESLLSAQKKEWMEKLKTLENPYNDTEEDRRVGFGYSLALSEITDLLSKEE